MPITVNLRSEMPWWKNFVLHLNREYGKDTITWLREFTWAMVRYHAVFHEKTQAVTFETEEDLVRFKIEWS